MDAWSGSHPPTKTLPFRTMVIWRRDAFVTYLPILSLRNGIRLSQEPARRFCLLSFSSFQNSPLLSFPILARCPVLVCMNDTFQVNNSLSFSKQVCVCVCSCVCVFMFSSQFYVDRPTDYPSNQVWFLQQFVFNTLFISIQHPTERNKNCIWKSVVLLGSSSLIALNAIISTYPLCPTRPTWQLTPVPRHRPGAETHPDAASEALPHVQWQGRHAMCCEWKMTLLGV